MMGFHIGILSYSRHQCVCVCVFKGICREDYLRGNMHPQSESHLPPIGPNAKGSGENADIPVCLLVSQRACVNHCGCCPLLTSDFCFFGLPTGLKTIDPQGISNPAVPDGD